MKSYSGIFYNIYHWFAVIPPKLIWKTKNPLSPEERQKLIKLLAKGHYIILTSNNSHLSSILVKFMTFCKTGKYPKYSHALMNCDFMDKPEDVDQFKFVEATVVGVHYSKFDEAFDCDRVCLLSPKNMTNENWTKIIDALVEQNGRPYDDLFNLSDSTRISCVELVFRALKAADSYDANFDEFDKMIENEGNLLPQMFRDCSDFEVVYET